MSIVWDGDDATNGWGAGDGGLIATRSGTNVTIKPPTIIDATASNYLRVVVKNTTKASTFRFLVVEATGSSWLTFNISNEDTEFQTYDFQLDQPWVNWTLSGNNTPTNPDFWNASNENVSLLFRGGFAAGEGNIFIDKIQFYSVSQTFFNFIENSGFDDSPFSATE